MGRMSPEERRALGEVGKFAGKTVLVLVALVIGSAFGLSAEQNTQQVPPSSNGGPTPPAQPEKVNPNTTSYPDGYTPTGPVVGSTAERR